MTVEIKVPTLGESVTEATVVRWFKAPGDKVAPDEPLVSLETDKVSVEVNAETAGTLADIVAGEGEDVAVGAVLGHMEPASGASAAAPRPAPEPAQPPAETPRLSPSVRRLVEEHGLDPAEIQGSGRGGRLLKADVLAAIAAGKVAADSGSGAAADAPPPAPPPAAAEARPEKPAAPSPQPPATPGEGVAGAREERVPMSRLRRRAAERLKLAQDTAAMLTTFNEVDMTAVAALRTEYREAFEAKHGVRLGFMPFFVKAAALALAEFPLVNAAIDGDDIVYRRYCDIGVAVSTPRGLIVPVLRGVERMDFAAIERGIREFGAKARDGKLAVDDLVGGTFTISNGGVFGSLLSTPILNPPQSAILGMHKVQDRPVAVDGEVEIRPMMYLALSYDHRLIDGREAVSFLIRIKECIEDPRRILLDL